MAGEGSRCACMPVLMTRRPLGATLEQAAGQSAQSHQVGGTTNQTGWRDRAALAGAIIRNIHTNASTLAAL